MKMLLKKLYTSFWFHIFWLFPLQKKVLFSSFSGKKYGDNPKYISDMLFLKNNEIEQVWLYKEKFDMVKDIKQVKWGSIGMIYHLATSLVWVDSHTKPEWVLKRKKQFYIETWHGGLGMKKIEGDAEEQLPASIVRRTKHNSQLTDLLISNSDWLTNIYKRAFWYTGEILECGYPKNDILFAKDTHSEIIEKVHKYYQIPSNVSILLYAPTFRENSSNLDYGLQLDSLLSYLNNNTNSKWVIGYRLHPLLAKCNHIFKDKSSTIINMTNYPDMQELIIGSDILITDYSSCIFDFAMLKKPGFIYTNDLEEYEKERGLYFDLRTLPFPFSETTEELINNMQKFNIDLYQKELDDYFRKMGLKEAGTATSTIVDIILENIKENGK